MLILLITALLTAFAHTAPIVGTDRRVTDDVRSLARLDRVAIAVDARDAAPQLAKLGLSETQVTDKLIEVLKAADIVVDNRIEDTTVMVRIREAVDVDTPDSIAFNVTASLWQRVHVERLDQTLDVPTYHYTVVGLFPRTTAAQMVQPGVGLAVGSMLTQLERAKREQGTE